MFAPILLFVFAGTTSPLPSAASPATEAPRTIPASAEPVELADGRAPVALLAGGLTCLVPLVVGSLLVAQDDRPARQETGVYVMASGFALAPVVAHVARRSWRRALVFGAVSFALSGATVIAMRAIDVFDPATANMRRVPYGVLFTAAFASAAVGVIAAELAPAAPPTGAPEAERPAARLSLWLAPETAGISWSHPL